MVKALLFDVDGVLVNEEKKYFSHFLEEEYAIPRSKTHEFFNGEFLESVEEALRFWHTKEHIINDPLIDEILTIKEKGIKIYTATNQEIYRTNYIREDMGFGNIFDEVIASSMLGYRKPDKNYYNKILLRIGQDPEDVLFWDDSEENIEAAKNIGMHAELYKNFQEFRSVMKEIYQL